MLGLRGGKHDRGKKKTSAQKKGWGGKRQRTHEKNQRLVLTLSKEKKVIGGLQIRIGRGGASVRNGGKGATALQI